MKHWEELICGNVFGLKSHWDHLSACLAHMLYCIVAEEQYNLAYFFAKRIVNARDTPTTNLPYGMFLTRLYQHVMEIYPHLDNDIYSVVDRVIRSLALKQNRKLRSDHRMPINCHCVSSLSAYHFGSSSHHEDGDEDDGTYRASTPSPTSFLNSLSLHTHQTYNILTSSQQTDHLVFERQTTLLNQTQQIHKEVRCGFKSFGKTLKEVFEKMKK
nr:hypothetical protein [Tanacetum cinerariifolium]